MLEAVEGNIHQRLCALLDEHRARYRVMAHEAVGQCEAVSAIRGTALGRGAKALVCKVKGNGVNQHVLAILAADRQADLASLARHIGGSKASLASPAEVDALTACVFGAIPPSVSIRRCGWWRTRCCLNAFHKSPLTPGAWTGRSFSTPKTIYISPDQRSRPFAVLANRASAQISAAWRKILFIHATMRRVSGIFLAFLFWQGPLYMFDTTLLILLGLAALGFISHNTTVAISILVLIIVRVTPLNAFFPG